VVLLFKRYINQRLNTEKKEKKEIGQEKVKRYTEAGSN